MMTGRDFEADTLIFDQIRLHCLIKPPMEENRDKSFFEEEKSMWKQISCIVSSAVVCFAAAAEGQMVRNNPENVRKVHLIQDDAQDYMVSKIYPLKYAQANDLIPFVSGIVMRYNINSAVNSIEFGNNQQWLTVTCPEKNVALYLPSISGTT